MKKSFKNASGYEIELGHAYCEKKGCRIQGKTPKPSVKSGNGSVIL